MCDIGPEAIDSKSMNSRPYRFQARAKAPYYSLSMTDSPTPDNVIPSPSKEKR
ncbi:hypothetical protein SAMN05660971_00795 [Halomonas cupida]|uniref:Uncharacterized protein n=1 Tax=Halomonas cupida TaxID=44933 RepID=A0A1M7B8B8_9GAMM|nr:hypothetical protein SAMN05660971_00795 [Halomonas cupida]